MTEYVLRLVLLLPLICGLIVGGLWLTKRVQERAAGLGGKTRTVRLEEVMSLTPTTKVAVLSFAGERILVSIGKNGVTRLARARADDATDEGDVI
jgi:flagellar protein FliO/FliZ|tara:strand:+ start:46329 stop:46613 length:285 start_codon:yes stop_codon:yes gene_type:complete